MQKKINHPTMFEVSDKNRQYETTGNWYIKPFVDFLKSFVDAMAEYDFSNTVLISGEKFEIDVSHCSYTSRNAYTRETIVRKEKNRYIRLSKAGYKGATIFKIHFNTEYDVDVLKKKINDALISGQKIVALQQQREKEKIDNTTAIALHYLSHTDIRNAIQYVSIDNQLILFLFKDNMFVLVVSPENILLTIRYNMNETKSLAALNVLTQSIQERVRNFERIVHQILSLPPISKELQEWATKSAYNNTFYTNTMSTIWKSS